MFQVVKLSDLTYIIEHFNSYPLKTQKYADFILFKKAIDVMNNKEHLTEVGLCKLVSLRASINKGLPERLQVALPNVTPELRPEVTKANVDSNNLDVKY